MINAFKLTNRFAELSKQIPGGVFLRFLAFCLSAFALDADGTLALWLFSTRNKSVKILTHTNPKV